MLTVGALPAGITPITTATDGGPLRAVVIVGPAASSTTTYLQDGERIARQAEAQGMDVQRVFTPRATWARVKAALQGANLVVYLGYGNGWPSNMGPFRGASKDGFGLNPCEGCGTTSPVSYHGEDLIRSQVRLARNAVVLLRGLCYASGNAESHMPAVFDRDLATARTSNYASGFLDAGAGAVFALGWRQNLDLPAALMNGDRTRSSARPHPDTPAPTTGSWAGTTTPATAHGRGGPACTSIRIRRLATCGRSAAISASPHASGEAAVPRGQRARRAPRTGPHPRCGSPAPRGPIGRSSRRCAVARSPSARTGTGSRTRSPCAAGCQSDRAWTWRSATRPGGRSAACVPGMIEVP
jgi:hypothetical protein